MTRGLAVDEGLFGWLTTLYPVWGRIDEETLDELETRLVTADVGLETSAVILDGLRGKVVRHELGNIDALRSATTVAADIIQRRGRLGIVAPGATADLLVVDGNPLKDINVLVGQGERLQAIVKDGRFMKNELEVQSQHATA